MKQAILCVIISLFLFEPSMVQAFDTNYQFTGQEKDPLSELYNYNARFYEPMTGRFTQTDPLQNYLVSPELQEKTNKELEEILANPQQLNSYGYTAGNPVNFVDPTGEFNRETGEVEAGDTLSKIFGDQWREVAEYNNLENPNLIYPGQILQLPWENGGGIVNKAIDIGTGIAPGVSDIRDVVEFIYGKDLASGQKFSYIERAEMGAIAALPILSGPIIRKVKKFGQKLSNSINRKIVDNQFVRKISKFAGLDPDKIVNKLNFAEQLNKFIDGFGQILIDVFRR